MEGYGRVTLVIPVSQSEIRTASNQVQIPNTKYKLENDEILESNTRLIT